MPQFALAARADIITPTDGGMIDVAQVGATYDCRRARNAATQECSDRAVLTKTIADAHLTQ